MKKWIRWGILGFAWSVVAFSTAVQAQGEKIVWVSHGSDSNSFFNVIKNAIKIADKDLGTQTDYRNAPTGDTADMVRIIAQASAAGVDGIVTTIAEYDMLESVIKDAIAKGIPVVTANSGTAEDSANLGALIHVGQAEYEAGLDAGKRAQAAGVTRFLCVNHFMSHPVSIDRCRGFSDGLGIELGNQMIDSGTDPSEIKNKVKAYLAANPDTNAILGLGPDATEPTILAVKEMGLDGDIYFATFDLSSNIVAAIKEGTIAFAIDQQAFLQGYLPVQVLAHYIRYGVVPSRSIATGPAFVDRENVAQVERLAGEYR